MPKKRKTRRPVFRGKGRGGRPAAPEIRVPRAPLLSVAMMVRDEEEFLEDALLSCKDWVDELVVVDTGSKDRTVEIAQDLGAVVSHFEWCDSFAAARNATLERATGRWIAILDADERFSGANPAAVRNLLVPGAHFPFEVVLLKVKNVTLEGAGISSAYGIRIVPNDPRLRYTGQVHNQLVSVDPTTSMLFTTTYVGLEILHLGYDKGIYKRRNKSERSLPLIQAVVKAEPENGLFHFYLGRECLMLGKADEAIAALERAVELIRAPDMEEARVDALLETYLTLLRAYQATKRSVDEWAALAEAALEVHPKHPDFLHALGLAALVRGSPETAADFLERAVRHLDDVHATRRGRIELEHGRWHALEQLGHSYWGLQRYPEAYRAFMEALQGKPEGSRGWPEMLNCMTGLAIDLGEEEHLPELLERLLRRDDTSLGMFFFYLDRLSDRGEVEKARTLLDRARGEHPRVTEDPEHARITARLG